MGKISKNELNDSLKLEIENAGAEIVNDFSGGVNKVASAEIAKTLNTNQQTTNTQLAQDMQDLATHKTQNVASGVHGLGSIASKQYVTGIWTPKIYDAGGAPTDEFTYASRSGNFVTIGDYVFITAEISCSGKGTLSENSNLYLSGLPYVCSGISVFNVLSENVIGSLSKISVRTLVSMSAGSLLKERHPLSTVSLNAGDVASNFKIFLSGFYKIN